MNTFTYPNTRPFLLMEGGPLYRIEKRVGLIKKNSKRMVRSALVSILLTWFVLLVLSAVQGRAIGSAVAVPFLRDFSAYARFFVAVPLFLLAETVLGPRLAEAAECFVTSGLVPEANFTEFDQAVERGLRRRDSVVAEIIIAAIAYVVSLTAFRLTAVHSSSWYGTRSASGTSLTWAGWWLLLFCVPLLNFLVLRWLWRLYLWFQFLGQMRRLDVRLFPTHPDRAGGLGFVGEAQRYFGILVFTYSIVVAGVLANQIVYDKVPLPQFAPGIAVYVIAALAILVLPLSLFTPKLAVTRHRGLQEYGALGTAYTGSFQEKWIKRNDPSHEQLLGTSDIQSLADMGGSYSLIKEMKILPISLRTLLHLIVASLLPLLPLLLTVMPLGDLLKLLLKILA